MDEALRALEREAAANPGDLDRIKALVRATTQSRWRFEGKTLQEHIQALILHETLDPDSFDPGEEELRVARALGLRLVPALTLLLETSPFLATSFRAALVLGELQQSALAALTTLLEGLFAAHPLTRLHTRWTLGRLTPQAMPLLLERVQSAQGELETLLDALACLGRQALPACERLEALAAESEQEARVEALLDAVDRIRGRGQPAIPEVIPGPRHYCLGEEVSADLRAFDREVWGYEVSCAFHDFGHRLALDQPQTWFDPELSYTIDALQTWRPHDLVLQAPAALLTHFGEHEVEDLVRVESSEQGGFARAELFFAAERALQGRANPEAHGALLELEFPRPDCPRYFVGPAS